MAEVLDRLIIEESEVTNSPELTGPRINPSDIDPSDGINTFTERVADFGGRTVVEETAKKGLENGTVIEPTVVLPSSTQVENIPMQAPEVVSLVNSEINTVTKIEPQSSLTESIQPKGSLSQERPEPDKLPIPTKEVDHQESSVHVVESVVFNGDIEKVKKLTDQLFESDNSKERGSIVQQLQAELGWAILDEDPKSPIRETLDDLWGSPDFIHVVAQGYVERFKNLTRSEMEQGKDLYRSENEPRLAFKIFRELGFSDEEHKDIARSVALRCENVADVEQRFRLVAKNFKTMIELFTANPEYPKTMYDLFGIRCFGRYSANQLINQLHSWDHLSDGEKEMPVAVVATAVHDWNGAFSKVGREYDAINENDPDQPIKKLFIEASSQKELTTRLVTVRRRYGPINGLFLGAHGSPESARLGHRVQGPEGLITGRDVTTPYSLQRMVQKGLFTKEAEIFLDSCSAGVPDGWAEDLSESLGLDVIASPYNSSNSPLKKIRNLLGKIRFVSHYRPGKIGVRRVAGVRIDGDEPGEIDRLRAKSPFRHHIDLTD